jgi:hypothetical protein
VVFEGLAISTKAVVELAKGDQQYGWSSRTHLSIRKICAWNVELNWTPFYCTSGIVQIMPGEFMKGLRIVKSSRAVYLFGLYCGSTEGEQFLIGFVASITLPERGNPSEDLLSVDF